MLEVRKKVVCSFIFPYAVCVWDSASGKRVVCATESEGKCVSFSALSADDVETVTDGPGGTMTIVPAGKDAFLMTHAFFKGMRGRGAYVSRIRKEADGSYSSEKCFSMPFLHRFTVISVLGEPWLIGATIADDKEDRSDWSRPGRIYAGKLSEEPVQLKELFSGLYKNHGMYAGPYEGCPNTVICTGEQGAFAVFPPQKEGDDWQVRQILNGEISDIRVFDLDGDGEEELVTIEGFHGDRMYVYKRNGGVYERVYSFPLAFGHPVWCGMLLGTPRILIGSKEANSGLFVLTPRGSADGPAAHRCMRMDVQMIDEQEQCSNIGVWEDGGRFYIFAACSSGNVIRYELTEQQDLFKLEIYIPKDSLRPLQEALRSVDAGHIGNYDSCLSYSPVMSTWRPLAGTHPFIGSEGEISEEEEYKVEVTVRAADLSRTVAAIREVHPYEEPVIDVIPLRGTGLSC